MSFKRTGSVLTSIAPSVYSKIALITCFVACIGDFLVTFFIGSLYKNYNFLTEAESYLGTDDSPVAIYMNLWEVLLSLLLIACVYCLYKTGFSKTRLPNFAIWLIAIYGIGEGIGSGLFPFNHVHNELTLIGVIHSIFSGIGITALVVLSFVLIKLFPKKIFPELHKTFLWFAIGGIFFILLCLLSRLDVLRFIGLWQRLFILDYYLMLMVLTVHISKATRKDAFMAS